MTNKRTSYRRAPWLESAGVLRRVAVSLLACALPLMSPVAQAELEIVTFRSEVFGNERKLRILLPSGYHDPANQDRQYPVLYMNDGQNLFDAETSTFGGGEWQLDETAGSLQSDGTIPPTIIVGIDHAGRRERAREYLPYVDPSLSPPEPDPQGGRYPDFLEHEVIPYVERHYRAVSRRNSRMLGGSSYGALIALYTAVERPRLFSGLLLESPSLYVDGGRILDAAAASGLLPERVYVGVGTNETGQAECATSRDNELAVRDVRSLEQVLRQTGVPEDRILVVVDECAQHNETAWARRLHAALSFLLGSWR